MVVVVDVSFQVQIEIKDDTYIPGFFHWQNTGVTNGQRQLCPEALKLSSLLPGINENDLSLVRVQLQEVLPHPHMNLYSTLMEQRL